MRARRFPRPSKQAVGGARGPGAAPIHTLCAGAPVFQIRARARAAARSSAYVIFAKTHFTRSGRGCDRRLQRRYDDLLPVAVIWGHGLNGVLKATENLRIR